MSQENDNLTAALKQIHDAASQTIASLDELKQDSDAETLVHLEEIERQQWNTILEIDEMNKKKEKESKQLKAPFPIEFFLPPTRVNPNRRKIGNNWID